MVPSFTMFTRPEKTAYAARTITGAEMLLREPGAFVG